MGIGNDVDSDDQYEWFGNRLWPQNSSISATQSGKTGSTVMTVTERQRWQSIAVTPANPSVANRV